VGRAATVYSDILDGGTGRLHCQLVVIDGPDRGRACRIGEREAVVGTEAGCELVLSDDRVSGRHLAIRAVESRFAVRDLGSTNGTWYEGSRVSELVVPAGSTLLAGKTALRVEPEAQPLDLPPSQARRFGELVGESLAMREVFAVLERVAGSDATLLVEGETGTGKELAARAIHDASPRRSQRFVAINCSAIPETLLEAELFGHVRGAFTGAVGNRQGRLEQAHKGTLFLDEVGTMSAALQMKLLRVLQEREFERVGDSHTIKVDVRVIAATNSDLAKLVAEGQFREDLFYRLNVIPVQLPALRERKEDIPLLVQHFLAKFEAERDASAAAAGPKAAADRLPRVTVSQQGMRLLMAYQWPGNVRQLENAIERAVAFTAGRSQIDVDDLPTEVQQAKETAATSSVTLPEGGMDLDAFVANIERELIQRSLERTNGNKGQAARLLNLKRTTLVEKLKRLHK